MSDQQTPRVETHVVTVPEAVSEPITVTWWGLARSGNRSRWPLGVRWVPGLYCRAGHLAVFRFLGFRWTRCGRQRGILLFGVPVKVWKAPA